MLKEAERGRDRCSGYKVELTYAHAETGPVWYVDGRDLS
jgi:hypothetical protein